MEGEKSRVLLIEDNPGDARLIRELLTEGGGAAFDLEHVDSLSKGLSRLAQGGVDVILLDLTLPDSHDLDGLDKILAQTLEVPIVVLSGLSDEAIAINAVREGAQDYLVKGNVDSDLLIRSLRYAIERQHLRVALRESEERYRLLADNAADVIWTANMKWRMTYVSPSIKRLLGYTVEEMKRLAIPDILTPDSLKQASKLIRNQMDIMAPESQHPPLSLTLEHVRKDGSTLWAEVMLSFLWDKNGKLSEILGVTREVTERKKAEEAVRESEARFRTVFEGTSLGIALVDFNAKTLGINPAFERMLGYNLEEFRQLEGNLKYLYPEDAMADANLYIEMLKGKRDHYTVDKRYIRKDGAVIWGRQNLSVVRDVSGKPQYFIAMIEDISERKRMEEALRQGEERYRELVENANDIIYTHDLAGNFTTINKAGERVTGYRRDEVLAMNISRILTPESLELAQRMIGRKVNQGGSTQYELEIIARDGHHILLEVSSRLIFDGDKPVSVQGIARDITERKRMEEALRTSEERLRRYWDNSPDAIYIHDLKGTFLRGNKAGEELLGYSANEIEGRSLLELPILPPEYLPKAIQLLQLSEAGKPTGPDEFELIRKDGSHKFVEISAYPITQRDKIEVIGIARDITERKKMEQELLRLSDAVRMSTDSITITDIEGNVVDVNEATVKIQGARSKSDLIGLKSSDFIAPEEMEKALIDLSRTIDEGHAYDIQYHVLTRDGRRVLVETNASVMRGKNGEPVGVVAITRDITERKKMEQQLRRLSDAVAMSKDAIAITNLEGIILEANEATLKMYGLENREDLIGRAVAELIAPEDLERLTERMAKAVATGYVPYIEYHGLKNDGSKFLIEASVSVTKDKSGEPTGYMAVARDITERKRMEEALRESEEKHRLYFENASDVIYSIDTEGKLLTISPSVERALGYKPEELMGKNMTELGIVTPETLEKALSDVVRVLAGERVTATEGEFIAKDGTRKFGEVSAAPVFSSDGRAIAVICVARDTTERKRMEDALKRSEHNYRTLFESTIDGMFVLDVETWKIMIANQTALRMFGFDCVEAIIGANMLDLIHLDERDRISRIIKENEFGKGLEAIRELRAVTRDGRQIWLSVMGTRIEYEGKIADLVSTRDITEHKRMEEERQKMEEQLRLAGRLAAVGELAAGVAHELNNPIAAIQGFAQFLTARQGLDETIRKDLDTIYRESQRAAKITQNLLSFARRHEPEKHLISINEAIEKTLELQAHPMKVNNIELVVELAPDLPKTFADFHQMQQVFINIINNAEQAMVEAHGKGKLVVKTQKVSSMIRISFADNGPGISEETMKRMFDPFFTTKEVGKGTGLGLSICYGLVEAHGGRIYARSKLGQGATFVVEIPIVSENQLIAESALLKLGSRGATWKKPR